MASHSALRSRTSSWYASSLPVPAGERLVQRLEPAARVGDERHCAELVGVHRHHVEADEAHVVAREGRHRAGDEVAEARADAQHQVGAGGEPVGRQPPLAPTGPAFIGWSQGSAPLPAWVSTTGTP
jgi:hypothetical protein